MAKRVFKGCHLRGSSIFCIWSSNFCAQVQINNFVFGGEGVSDIGLDLRQPIQHWAVQPFRRPLVRAGKLLFWNDNEAG